jgi:hypothetical protein
VPIRQGGGAPTVARLGRRETGGPSAMAGSAFVSSQLPKRRLALDCRFT